MTVTSRLRVRRSKGAAIAAGMTIVTAATATTAGADVAAITAVMIAAGITDAVTKGMDAARVGTTVVRLTVATSAASCARSVPNGVKNTGATTFTSASKGFVTCK